MDGWIKWFWFEFDNAFPSCVYMLNAVMAKVYFTNSTNTIHQSEDKKKNYADASIHRIFSIINICFLQQTCMYEEKKRGTINKCGSYVCECVWIRRIDKERKNGRVRVRVRVSTTESVNRRYKRIKRKCERWMLSLTEWKMWVCICGEYIYFDTRYLSEHSLQLE